MSVTDSLRETLSLIDGRATLVAVSKTHPAEAVMEAYSAGQRIFGENRPQEMTEKWKELPKDIEWHMIGHLQTNKVRMIAPYVRLIHSVDSERLLAEIDRQAQRLGRVIDCLMEVHIAMEETKSGWDADEVERFLSEGRHLIYSGVRVRGLMTVGTLSDDISVTDGEFARMENLFLRLRQGMGDNFDTLSMGMSSDWETALRHGATMVRIGSSIFGQRDYRNRH